MLVEIKVKPNSSKPRIEKAADGSLVAFLRSPPVEGKANEELLRRVAEHFGVPKSRVRIKSGLASRKKIIEIV